MAIRLVVLMGLALASYFYFYPRYQIYQAEKAVRLEFKMLPSEGTSTQLTQFGQYDETIEAKTEFLNQYPNLLFYTTLLDPTQKTLPADSHEQLNKISCQSLESIKYMAKPKGRAYFNVFKEDQVTYQFTIKTHSGDILLNKRIPVTRCENFNEIEQEVRSSVKFVRQNDVTLPSTVSQAELDASERRGGY